jgi:hypothetical protein
MSHLKFFDHRSERRDLQHRTIPTTSMAPGKRKNKNLAQSAKGRRTPSFIEETWEDSEKAAAEMAMVTRRL